MATPATRCRRTRWPAPSPWSSAARPRRRPAFVDDRRPPAGIAQFDLLRPAQDDARLEFAFLIARQNRLLARRERQPAGPGVEPGDLPAPGPEIALRLRGKVQRLELLAINRQRVAEEVARLRVADLRDFNARNRYRRRHLLQHLGADPPVDQPPLLPADVGQRDAELLAARVRHQHRRVRRRRRSVLFPAPPVPVAPQLY